MNKVFLVGRLTRDPELRQTQNGVPFVGFTVAISRPFTNQQGERQTDFINCMVFRQQAENLAKFMTKGSQIGIDGTIQSRQIDVNGQNFTIMEVLADRIEYLESRTSTESRSTYQPQTTQNPSPYDFNNQQSSSSDEELLESSSGLTTEDDLPF